MKTRISYYLLIIVLISFFANCSKYDPNCGQYQDKYYKLTDDSKSKISFKGFDTLVFISNVGDTAILFGHGKTQTNRGFPQQTTNADCPGITEYYEKIEIGFWGNHPEMHFVGFKYYADRNDYFDISINDQMKFNNLILSAANNLSYYSDSIVYKNTKIYSANIPANGGISGSLLFNYEYGVLRIKTNGGKTWVLN